MNYFEEVKKELFKYKYLGEETVSDTGALLIGHAPHIAPQAWLHKIYPVLNDDDIAIVESNLNTRIPSDYKYFLQHNSNGLNIFVATFALNGHRKQLGRSIAASRQPFGLDIPNVDERPDNAKDSYFFIGSYSWDGSKLYIDKETGKVHYCDRWDAASLYKWNSFEEMLVSEVKRICDLFDEKGVTKDPAKCPTPVERKLA
jgi:hypothetical protein